MVCSKGDGTLGAKASIDINTRGTVVLFPLGRKNISPGIRGIISRGLEYSTPKGPRARIPNSKFLPMNNHILHDHSTDGVDRRGFLKCMAWAGTGVLWSISGGVLSSRALGQAPAGGAKALAAPAGTLNF